MNRLEKELSPYLNRRSADSINWYPWGEEAFALAQQEHKPMRIVIGSTACPFHPAGGTVARLTERYFIPVQVDCQEHPHVAAVYRKAAAMLTGQHTLPLEIFTDEMGNPFFATGAVREVELAGLLSGIALNRSSTPSAYDQTAAILHKQLTDTPIHPFQSPHSRFSELQREYDEENGGFGKGGKALRPHDLLFLLHHARSADHPLPMQMLSHTLTNLAAGGIRDHMGGGFFHRTTDPQWQQPVPEKRLMDQALMLAVFTRAWEATGTKLYRQLAAETADFAIRELRHGAGGFYTAQWSEDGFWLLTRDIVCAAVGQNHGDVFCRKYFIGEEPAIPRLHRDDDPCEDSVLLHDLRMKLYRDRLQRGTPHRDEKVLTGENGIMIAALARAGRIFGVERYITAAANAEEFLRSRLVSPTDLRRYYCHAAAWGDGAMIDYAGYAMGLLELYRCGCGGEFLANAARVMTRADALFSNHEVGGWYLSRADGCLPMRPMWQQNTEHPSERSIALWTLTELAKEIPHPGIRKRARELLGNAV